jgi:hypothetical protein
MTKRQQLFIHFYLADSAGRMNGAKAARRAGYRNPKQDAYRLLSDPDVKAAIDSALNEAAMSAAEVLYRLSVIARGSMGAFLYGDDDDNIIAALSLDTITARENIYLVKNLSYGMSNGERYISHIKLHDPLAALDKLAKAHGLYDNQSSELERLIQRLFDSGKLSDRQVDLIAQGADPLDVLIARPIEPDQSTLALPAHEPERDPAPGA